MERAKRGFQLGLIIGLLVVGATGALAWAGAQDDRVWIPEPTPGSTWRYEVNGGGQHVESWAWSHVEAVRSADGTFVAARFLEQVRPISWSGWDAAGTEATRYAMDRHGQLVAGIYNWTDQGSFTNAIAGPLATRHERQSTGAVEIWPFAGPFCPLPVFQDEQRLDPRRPVGDLCPGAGVWTPVAEMVFAESTAHGYESEHDGTAWFIEGLPVPVRWERDGIMYELLDYEWTDDAWNWHVDLPPADAWQPVKQGPVHPWGPDETGIQHPFPLSLAYETAMSDPTFTDLQGYLVEHPRAVAVQGLIAEYEDDENRGDWLSGFVLTDGDELFAWAAIHRVDQTITHAVNGLLGDTDVRVPLAYVSVRADHSPGFGDPQRLPAQMPTVAATLAREEEAHGPGRPNEAWSFQAICLESCDGPRWLVQAGAAKADQDFFGVIAANIGPFGPVTSSARLAMADDLGRTLALGDGAAVVDTQVRTGTTAAEGPTILPSPGINTRVPAAIGLVAVAAAFVALAPKLKAATLGLFTRLLPQRIAEHPSRQSILDAVAAEPGIHQEELSRRTGLLGGTLEHHLRALVRAERLQVVHAGGYKCLFPSGTPRQALAAGPVLRAATAQQILHRVQKAPGITQRELAQQMALAPATIAHHTRRLREAGVIDARRQGRSVGLWAA